MKETLPKWVWGYYSNCGRTLNFTFDKKYAEMNADGYTWDNPRVRKVGVIHPSPPATPGARRHGHEHKATI